jgi:hypothetical protein
MFTPLAFKQPQLVTNGLVLYLDAGDRTSYVSGSTVWRSLSGDLTGSLTNGPTFNSGNGGSIVFDGVDDNVVLGNVLNLGTGDMTINSWINLAVVGTNQQIYSKSFYGGQDYRYSFAISTDGKLMGFVQGNNPGLDIVPAGSTTLLINRWYMATMVINRNSNVQLYLNGVLETLTGNATISQWAGLNFQSNNPARWASYTFSDNISPNFILNGRIGVGQIYNRALSASEITQNFNAQRQRFNI